MLIKQFLWATTLYLTSKILLVLLRIQVDTDYLEIAKIGLKCIWITAIALIFRLQPEVELRLNISSDGRIAIAPVVQNQTRKTQGEIEMVSFFNLEACQIVFDHRTIYGA